MPKNTKRRTPTQVTRDRRKIAQMYLAGHYQEEIAEALGVDQSTVSRDLKTLLVEWQKETKQDIELYKTVLIQKYVLIYREAYNAWLKSLKPAVTKERGNSDKGSFNKIKRVGQSGNPALLAQAQSALKSIREILGIDAPIKVDWREQLPDGYSPEDIQQQFIGLMQVAADNANSD